MRARVAELLRRLRILPREPREPLRGEILRSLHVLLGASFLVLGLELAGCLTPLETPAIDRFLRMGSTEQSDHVVIVQIDREAYETTFNDSSPLEPNLVYELVKAIQAGGAKVIGVDLDTSAAVFARNDWPEGNVVWARDATPLTEYVGELEHEPMHGDADDLVRKKILGGVFVESKTESGRVETDPPSGIALFSMDADGFVRRYSRTFYSSSSEPSTGLKGHVESFPLAILAATCTADGRAEGSEAEFCERLEELRERAMHGGHDLILNYTGDRYGFRRIPAQVVLESANQAWWTENSPLKGKIVLLGGTYPQARDKYPTPVGPRFGVELVAQVIEAELEGGGIDHANIFVAFLFDLIAGLVFIWLNWRISVRYTIYVSFIFIILVSLVGSYTSFCAFGYWFNFMAVLISLWIHMLWHKGRHDREERDKIQKELKQYRAKYGELETAPT